MDMTLPRIVLLSTVAVVQAHAQLPCEEEKITPKIRLDDGHPWRPPFGLDRVGRPVIAVVDIAAATRPLREYYLTGFLNGQETERHVLNLGQSQASFANTASFADTVSFPSHPDELVL